MGDSQLFHRPKLDSQLELHHCFDWPTERSNRYQQNLQSAKRMEMTWRTFGNLPGWLRRWLGQIFPHLFGPNVVRPVLQNGQEAGLTEQELVAIFGWTVTDYQYIKPISWGADKVEYFSADDFCTLYREDVWPEIEVLVGALDKLPQSTFNGTLWRGWSSETPEDLDRMMANGTGGFFSTSRNLEVSLGFAGPTLWAIESHHSGKDIAAFSQFNEEEILFPMGNRMEVVNCSSTTVDDAMWQTINEYVGNLTVVCVKEAPAQSKTVMKEAPPQSETVMSGAPAQSEDFVV